MYPVGILSVTDTPVAALGPLLVTSNVKIIVSPTFGVVLSTDLTISKSETATGIGVFVSESSVLSGSGSFPATVAVFA